MRHRTALQKSIAQKRLFARHGMLACSFVTLISACSQPMPEQSQKASGARSNGQVAKNPALALEDFTKKMARPAADAGSLQVTKILPTPTSLAGVSTLTVEINASGLADYVEIQQCHILKGTCEPVEKIAVTRAVLKPMDAGEIQIKAKACVNPGRSTSVELCGPLKSVVYEAPEATDNNDKSGLIRERDVIKNQLKNLEDKVTKAFQKFVTDSEECVKRDQKSAKVQSLRMGAQMVLAAGQALTGQAMDPGAVSPSPALPAQPTEGGSGSFNLEGNDSGRCDMATQNCGGAPVIASNWTTNGRYTSLADLTSAPSSVLRQDPAFSGSMPSSGGGLSALNSSFNAPPINGSAADFNTSPEATSAVRSFGVSLQSFENGNARVQNFLGNIGLFEQAPPVKAVSLLTNTVLDLFTAKKQVAVACRAQEMAQNEVDSIQFLRSSLLSRLQIIDNKIQERGIK